MMNTKTESPTSSGAAHGSEDYTSSGMPVVHLETKLEYVRMCIVRGNLEDALGHLDDLRESVILRGRLLGLRRYELTPDGVKLLRYTEPNDQAQRRPDKDQ